MERRRWISCSLRREKRPVARPHSSRLEPSQSERAGLIATETVNKQDRGAAFDAQQLFEDGAVDDEGTEGRNSSRAAGTPSIHSDLRGTRPAYPNSTALTVAEPNARG